MAPERRSYYLPVDFESGEVYTGKGLTSISMAQFMQLGWLLLVKLKHRHSESLNINPSTIMRKMWLIGDLEVRAIDE